MDAFKTPGAPSWAELITTDPAAAADFYAKLLGWTYKPTEMQGGTYHEVQVDGTGVAGIMAMPPGSPPMPPNWGTYVTVANVDESAQRAEQLGGTILVPPSNVPGVGRFTVIQDPQGAMLSLITYEFGTDH